jgi:hypothetical protein
VRWSLHYAMIHDTACNTPVSITQPGTVVVLVAREALESSKRIFFHQRLSDSTRWPQTEPDPLSHFSMASINHFVQVWR